ncbi:MAG: alpha/beta hydrolase [Bdellovibrionales bacterium]|nr:alpha/beta hydrolase [Bdellovibrionales bacterium]
MQNRKWALIFIIISSFFGVSCTHLFYHPDKFLYTTPEVEELKKESLFFKNDQGAKLHSWYIPPKAATGHKGLILLFHGNAQNLSSHFKSLSWLCHQGYGLLVFDYQGYGLSEGSPSPRALAYDAKAALKLSMEVKTKHNYPKLILYGQSLGGAVLLKGLEMMEQKIKTDLVVLDSTFSNYEDLTFDIMRNSFLLFIFSPLAYLFISDEGNVDSYLPHFNYPALVIHGRFDQVVPFEHGKRVFKALGGTNKQFWEIPQGLHTDVFFRHDGIYRKKFLHKLSTL